MISSQPYIPSVPHHVAIIMDGNGRWAKEHDLPRLEGHKAGAKSVQLTVEYCLKKGIRYLTLFSFSTENWGRSSDEVNGLMEIFHTYLDSELDKLLENKIRLRAVGELSRLPHSVLTSLKRDIEKTKDYSALDVVLAVSYGGREEIVDAARRLAQDAVNGKLTPAEIDVNLFKKTLWTAEIPDPDLLIRTSGEMRVSNFLLWQLAYSEIVVVPELWPDFREETLDHCLLEYSRRERRFGLSSEQVRKKQLAGS